MPRELIKTRSDKRFVRRDEKGQFDDVVDVGKSLTRDRRSKAKRTVKAGEGDRGDQKRRSSKSAGGTAKASTKARAKSGRKKSTRRTQSAR